MRPSYQSDELGSGSEEPGHYLGFGLRADQPEEGPATQTMGQATLDEAGGSLACLLQRAYSHLGLPSAGQHLTIFGARQSAYCTFTS